MDTTGKGLVEHWGWAAEKGVMNKNTAAGIRAACSQVLSVLDNWEAVNVKTLDVEETLRRFQNLKAKDFKPTVLETYKGRFRRAVADYLEYLNDPGGWKPRSLERSGPQEKTGQEGERKVDVPGRPMRQEFLQSGFVDYPYPLREGQIARLSLPRDLKMTEVKRLAAFMSTLVVDFDPEAADAR